MPAEIRMPRPQLVVAALTIIRAYIAAGSPVIIERPFGRFEEWDRYVRQPLLWLDAPDSCKTRELVERNDPDRAVFGRLVHLWSAVFSTHAVRVKEIAALELPCLGVPPEARELYDLACESLVAVDAMCSTWWRSANTSRPKKRDCRAAIA